MHIKNICCIPYVNIPRYNLLTNINENDVVVVVVVGLFACNCDCQFCDIPKLLTVFNRCTLTNDVAQKYSIFTQPRIESNTCCISEDALPI